MTSPSHDAANTAQRDPRRHSISAKIVFLVFLCTFSTALVISGISIQSTYADLRRAIDRGFPAALERSSSETSVWLAEAETLVRGLVWSARPKLSGKPRSKAASSALVSFVEQSIHFDGVVLMGPDGQWLSHTAALEPARGGRVRVVLDPSAPFRRVTLSSPEPHAAVAVPISPGERDSRFLVARYDRALLDALLNEEHHDVAATLALTDAEGRILAAVPGPDGLPEGLAQSVGRLQAQPSGEVHEYASEHGVHALGAMLQLRPDAPDSWALVVEAPFSRAFAPMIGLVTRIFVIDLLISIVFIGAAYRITARMLRPIEDLSVGARLAAKGNYGLAVSDPGTHDEVGRLTRAFNEMMGKLRDSQFDLQEANRQLQSRNEELQRANEVLSQLSITDGLTKLHNHRYFQEILTREIKRQTRNDKPLSVLLVDLDDFKALNDRLGHASGDELLMRVASIMDATVRESDLLARYGGEEFVVLATDTDLEGAVQLAEKIRMAVEQAPHIVNESLRPVRITVSIGVAQYAGNRRQFFEAADRALYRAKDQGKNCVIAASEDNALD